MDDPRQRRRRLARPRECQPRATPATLAPGKYVAWPDADDELLPRALAAHRRCARTPRADDVGQRRLRP